LSTADPFPSDLLYHEAHDWARVDGDTATLGITWTAQDRLGEIVFAELPAVGFKLEQNEPYMELESTKAVSDVIAPFSGEVTEINDAVADSPETVNDDPYGEGWLVKVKLDDPSEGGALMDADAYKATIAE
jgi:glycine cleavage system H protein